MKLNLVLRQLHDELHLNALNVTKIHGKIEALVKEETKTYDNY